MNGELCLQTSIAKQKNGAEASYQKLKPNTAKVRKNMNRSYKKSNFEQKQKFEQQMRGNRDIKNMLTTCASLMKNVSLTQPK